MANKELKLYLPEETVRALEEAAATVEGYSRNEVAIDVIRQCLPIWLAAREAFDGVMEDFLRRTIDQARDRRSQQKR